MDQALKTTIISQLQSAQYQEAIDLLEPKAAKLADNVDAMAYLGKAYLHTQQREEASKYYEKALSLDPTHTAALCDYAELQLTGPNYLKALEKFHQRLRPETYVEVGVCKGVSFCLANPDATAIGIDPEPQLDISKLPVGHKVIAITSDNYFSSGTLTNDLNSKPLDMAFIDGMHLFEYALRDFINLEKHAHQNTVILVHDIYPMNAITAERERHADFWSGDVWKLMICLQEMRPDLECITLPCAPTGLGVITQLDPKSTILSDNLASITEKYQALSYDLLETNKAEKLNLASSSHPWLN